MFFYYVNDEMMGSDATRKDVDKFVEILNRRIPSVEFVAVDYVHDYSGSDPFEQSEWDAALEEFCNE